MTYGLPTGTNIFYGAAGFPKWVYDLAKVFNLKASTYPGHQENSQKGFAPNPNRLNRGIDWVGTINDMQRFADYLLTVKHTLEQVIWENPQTGRRVGVAGGDDVSTTGYYAADYAGHRDHVHTRQSQPIPIPAMEMTTKPGWLPAGVDRPDFNEYPIWSPSNESRGGTKVDLFLLHTEEGGPVKDGADRLARWLGDPRRQVSYHYTVSQDPHDRGVTVVDVVDTDRASWSALSANRRSINLVFAGSRAAWTRNEWLQHLGAINVAAYLAAQDSIKYGIPKRVIKPPYGPPGGISDHRYVTRYLKDGTHTDVGDGFPWDIFEAAFLRYAGVTPVAPPTPPPTPPSPAPPAITSMTDRQLLEAIYRAVIT